MIRLDLYGENFNIKSDWAELTGHEFLEVQKVCHKSPKKFKDILKAQYSGDKERLADLELSTREAEKTFPKFYGDFICALSDIPKSSMKKILKEDRELIFWEYLYKFAMGCLIAPVDVHPMEEDSFEFKSEKYPQFNGEYFIPKTKKNIMDEVKMGKISTIQFTESTDLKISMMTLDEETYHKIFNIVAILCLKEDEEYDEDVCLERAEAFRELTMDIVWSVFFYLEVLNIMSKSITESYTRVREAKLTINRHLKQQD